MDFTLSDRQRHWRDRVVDFMHKHVYPAVDTFNEQMNPPDGNRWIVVPVLEDLKKEGATVSKEATKPARTPATTEKGPGKVTFEGRNGDSLENAIIIKGARDGQEGVDAEHWWLRKHFPGYQPKGQGLLHREGKAYDKLEIVLPDGKQKEVFFDISSFFGT